MEDGVPAENPPEIEDPPEIESPPENESILENEPPPEKSCPICDIILSQPDTEYPLLCATSGCSFNMCHQCSINFLKTSKEGMQKASDGNLYRISMLCPSCRGEFRVDLSDVLVLREWRKISQFENIKDSELSAADLRQKYSIRNDEKLTSINESLKRYIHASESKAFPEEKKDQKIDNSDGLESKPCNIAQDMPSENQQIKKSSFVDSSSPITFLDSMLFQGLDSCMSQSEKTFILSLLTRGSPEHLSQAAHILASIVEMNKSASKERQIRKTQSEDSHDRRKLVARKSYQNLQDSRRMPRTSSIMSTNSSGASTRPPPSSSSAIPMSSSNQSNLRREAENERRWRVNFPLPSRMPKQVKLPLDFDFEIKRNGPIQFKDDEETLSFLHYNQRYNRMDYDLRKKLVDDAFCTLYVSWGKVKQRKSSNLIGPRNILLGLEHQAEERQLPDIKVPWRRVIVAYVDKSYERLGIRVGDVVTHVDGEVFDGNIEKLRFLLAMKKRDSSFVEVVLNADAGVAEALRLRAFMVRSQKFL